MEKKRRRLSVGVDLDDLWQAFCGSFGMGGLFPTYTDEQMADILAKATPYHIEVLGNQRCITFHIETTSEHVKPIKKFDAQEIFGLRLKSQMALEALEKLKPGE